MCMKLWSAGRIGYCSIRPGVSGFNGYRGFRYHAGKMYPLFYSQSGEWVWGADVRDLSEYRPGEWYTSEGFNDSASVGTPDYPSGFHAYVSIADARKLLISELRGPYTGVGNTDYVFVVAKVELDWLVAIGVQSGAAVLVAQKMMIASPPLRVVVPKWGTRAFEREWNNGLKDVKPLSVHRLDR